MGHPSFVARKRPQVVTGKGFIPYPSNYFEACSKRLLISSQFTVFHQAAR
jgi:hypothetical protein